VNNNAVAEIVEVKIGEIDSINESNFDLVIANINKHILIDIAPVLTGKVKQGGLILLSGLLNSDEEDVAVLYKDLGQNILETVKLDEWIALALRN